MERVYTRARELCQQVEDSPQLFPVLVGLRRFYAIRGELQRSQEFAEQLLVLAQKLHNQEYLLEAHFALALQYYFLGAFTQSRNHGEQGMAIYNTQHHHALAFTYGIDPGVHCLIYTARALCQLGFADQALARTHESLTLSHELSHPFSLVRAHMGVAMLYQSRREWRHTQEHADTCVALSTEHGFELYLAIGIFLQGWVLTELGQIAEGIVQMQQGLTLIHFSNLFFLGFNL